MVSVHAFKRWNHQKGEYHYPSVKMTEDGIKACRGVIIPDTEEKVHRSHLDFVGRYVPEKGLATLRSLKKNAA
ncbi:MAG: hypothetical protein WBD42_03250 [Methylovirgula sp.]